jgi:hypothetical protein
MGKDIIKHLGPIAPLAGTWEGDKGDDKAPDEDPSQIEVNKFREAMKFEPIEPIDNHAQHLFGLKYSTTVWRLGADTSFHEEVGYWLWDAAEKQVMKCFIVPRGVNVMAGGTVEPDAKEFNLSADVGSETYGISSNLFLDREFKTIRFEMKVTFHDENSFSYDEDTQLKIKGQDNIFHHTDKNTLKRLA